MHLPVLYQEALDALCVDKNGVYIDGTFGRGGHSAGLLAQLGEQGRLIALDQDLTAIETAQQDPRFQDPRFQSHHAAFSHLLEIVTELDLVGKVDGILLDIGVSSPQLDDVSRGFSFSRDGPLDMRMDQSQGQSAAEYLMYVKEEALANIIWLYGDERFSRRIAKAICRARHEQAIETTGQLAAITSAAIPKWEKHKHPATRTFQAIRIEVNQELKELERVLPQCLQVLKPHGRMAIIAFHSLEDRIVKEFLRIQSIGELPPKVPITIDMQPNRIQQIGKVIRPKDSEIANNKRARSAMMRVLEKIK